MCLVAAPTFTSLSPTSGHTGGKTLVEIRGTGFRVPDYPLPDGVEETPATVRVTFGGEVATLIGVVDDETILVLTPEHDESGVPATARNAAIAASDVIIENLDDDGAAIAGESVTAAEAFSFRKPILDEPSTIERAIAALLASVQRQLPRGIDVTFQPHTDYDDDTADALNFVAFAKLPGVALTGLRLPRAASVEAAPEQTVGLGDGRSLVFRAPTKRDVMMTLLVAAKESEVLLRLELLVEKIFEKLGEIAIPLDVGDPTRGTSSYQVQFSRGDPVTFQDRSQSNVVAFTAEVAILGVEETAMLGVPGGSLAGAPDWIPHEAATGIAWEITDPSANVGR